MRYLVTGAAGFIGSHLAEELVRQGHSVVGIDNLSNGLTSNIQYLKNLAQAKGNFEFVEADTRDLQACSKFTKDIDVVFHQAALGSVPRSFKSPLDFHNSNATGFLNVVHSSIENKVRKLIYASSSSVYGDDLHLPKMEDTVGSCLSPYAISKKHNELYAKLMRRHSSMQITGVRYFNVFGERQRADSAYSAVIPKWTHALRNGMPVEIFGDGETSRDFCYVKNVVAANMLIEQHEQNEKSPDIYNIACGDKTTLTELFYKLKAEISKNEPVKQESPIYRDFRDGDIRHSLANIERAIRHLNYSAQFKIDEGLQKTVKWFLAIP